MACGVEREKMGSLLQLRNVEKTYYGIFKTRAQRVLKGVTFDVLEGEFVSIMGESGAGKSTLLNIVATLDDATGGTVTLNGQVLGDVTESNKARFRREHLGFIFQDFDLLDTFNVQDNIYLPLVLAKKPRSLMEKRLSEIAPQLGLGDILFRHPYELSGGQKQRVAAARAMISHPELLLADEPTGSLDSKTALELLSVLERFNAGGQTTLMVTHSAVAASHSQRVLFMRDGIIFHQLYRGKMTQQQFLTKISETLTAMLEKSVQ